MPLDHQPQIPPHPQMSLMQLSPVSALFSIASNASVHSSCLFLVLTAFLDTLAPFLTPLHCSPVSYLPIFYLIGRPHFLELDCKTKRGAFCNSPLFPVATLFQTCVSSWGQSPTTFPVAGSFHNIFRLSFWVFLGGGDVYSSWSSVSAGFLVPP